MLHGYQPRYYIGWTLHFPSGDASTIPTIIKSDEEDISEGVDGKEGG